MPVRSNSGPRLSPDGWYYLRMAAGFRAPVPYARRWLLPAVLGPNARRWTLATYASLAATFPLAWWFTSDPWRAALLCLLPGIWRVPTWHPVTVDAPAFALALAVACVTRVEPVAGALLALVLGGIRETGPIFAALWAWSPYPLVGLFAVGWSNPSSPPDAPWLANPVREALALRRRLTWYAYIRPWGGALFGLFAPTWQMIITLIIAYAQLIMTQDTVRLTVWAAPVLVSAVDIPDWTWPAVLLWTVNAANPHAWPSNGMIPPA